MSRLRDRCCFILTAAIAFGGSVSLVHSQQRFPGILGIVGGVINSAIVDVARREWQNRPVADYNCLAGQNLSADQLAEDGIGPNDPRARQLLAGCAHASPSAPELSKSQPVTASIAGPHNPDYIVDGLALGGAVYPESAVYKTYTCRPSEDFSGFTWCARHRTLSSKIGPYTSWVTILHSEANKTDFITQAVIPAFFPPGDVDRETQRLSQYFGQAARILKSDAFPGVPHMILAAWGAVTLTPLDEAAMDALRRGEPIHRGLVADFVGDVHRSARIGLPVYSLGGGPGFLWGADFNDAGKGSLRISAVDASALGLISPPSTVAAAPNASPPTSPESKQPAPQTPSASDDCSKTADAAQRLACFDSAPGNAQAATSSARLQSAVAEHAAQPPAPESSSSEPDSITSAQSSAHISPLASFDLKRECADGLEPLIADHTKYDEDFNQCVDSEQTFLEYLKRSWPDIPEDNRSYCTQPAQLSELHGVQYFIIALCVKPSLAPGVRDEMPAVVADVPQILRTYGLIVRFARSEHGETAQQFSTRNQSSLENIMAFSAAFEKSGGTIERALKSLDGFSEAIKDPDKVKLIECLGVQPYNDSQPTGHPPSSIECKAISRKLGIPLPD